MGYSDRSSPRSDLRLPPWSSLGADSVVAGVPRDRPTVAHVCTSMYNLDHACGEALTGMQHSKGVVQCSENHAATARRNTFRTEES